MAPNNHRPEAPFGNSNPHLITGATSLGPMSGLHSVASPSCNMNSASLLLPVQNNNVPLSGLAVSNMQPGQLQSGFNLQNCPPSMNYGGMFSTNSHFGCFMPNTNQTCGSQPPYQLPVNNSMGFAYAHSQNNSFPTGQFFLHAPMNQNFPTPVQCQIAPYQAQGVPSGAPISQGCVFGNPTASSMGNSQCSTRVANTCSDVSQPYAVQVNQEQRAITCQAGINTMNNLSAFPQQLQQNLPLPSIGAVQHQQIPNYQISVGTNPQAFPQQLQQGIHGTSFGTGQHQQIPNCQPPVVTNPLAFPQQLRQGTPMTSFGAVLQQQIPNWQPSVGTSPLAFPQQAQQGMPMSSIGATQHHQTPNCQPTVGTIPLPFPQQVHQGMPTSSVGATPHHQIPNCQTSVGTEPQKISVQGNGVNISKPKFRQTPNSNFPRNPQAARKHWGTQKSGFQHGPHKHGYNGLFGIGSQKGIGSENEGIYAARARTRSRSLNYTEEEIKLWREERRKNYPTRATIERKSREKENNNLASQKEVESRRLQLKEILAKQAELGFEVAEIPEHYLCGTEIQGRKSRYDRKLPDKRRFSNKHNKWGRYNNKFDRFGKRETVNENLTDDNSSLGSGCVRRTKLRQPTLLQKLLASDIRRDRKRLRQVFRFMVINSFFDCKEKPLKFPVVEVLENGREVESIGNKYFPCGNGDMENDAVEECNEEGEIVDN